MHGDLNELLLVSFLMLKQQATEPCVDTCTARSCFAREPAVPPLTFVCRSPDTPETVQRMLSQSNHAIHSIIVQVHTSSRPYYCVKIIIQNYSIHYKAYVCVYIFYYYMHKYKVFSAV